MALKMAVCIIVSIFFSNSWAGNGSSGVGTASIIEGFGTENAEDLVIYNEDIILDRKTQEKIIKVTKLKKEEIDFQQLYPSFLGKVKGYEYIPNKRKEGNYWVVCKAHKNICYKLSPLSKTNKKVMILVGSLFEKL